MFDMMKQRKQFTQMTVLSACVLACGFSQNVLAGAWVPAEGTGYAKVGVTSYSADELFDDPQEVEFKGLNISYYGEYGLGNNLGVYWSAIYQDIEQTSDGQTVSNSGLGDVDLGFRYQWQAEPFVLSTSFLVKFPFLYNDDDDLPLGNGQLDYEFRALAGKGLNQYGYVGAEFGYRFRAEAPSDEYRYLLEYGFSVNDNLYLRTKLDGTLSANNAEVDAGAGGNLARTPEFDLGKIELTAGWNLGTKDSEGRQWGLEFTYTDEIYGEQTLNGRSFQFAITRVF